MPESQKAGNCNLDYRNSKLNAMYYTRRSVPLAFSRGDKKSGRKRIPAGIRRAGELAGKAVVA